MIDVRALASCAAAGILVMHEAYPAEPAPPSAWTTTSVLVTSGQARGYVQYQNHCSVCHGRGLGKPGTRALAAKYGKAMPALLEERTDLVPEQITYVVRHGLTVMPLIRKTEVSDTDLDAIASYLTRKRP